MRVNGVPVRVLKIGSDAKPATKAEIEAAFTRLQGDLIAEKQVTLEWIGYGGNVS